MSQICSGCSAPNRESARFCRACGQPLQPVSNNKFPPHPRDAGQGKRPTHSGASIVEASVEAASSKLTWQDQFSASSVAVKPPPLPPPFGLPGHEQKPLPAGRAQNEHLAGGSGRMNQFFMRPLAMAGVIGVLVLIFCGVWFGWASSTTSTENETVISASMRPAVAASSPTHSIEAAPSAELQINSVLTVPPVTEPTPVAPQIPPSMPLRPATKVDRGASVAKLSIPALPTPSETVADAPAVPSTMSVQSKANADLVIPSGPLSPKEACANTGSSGHAACLEQQCEKPALQQHAQCQRLRKERELEIQRLYSGS